MNTTQLYIKSKTNWQSQVYHLWGVYVAWEKGFAIDMADRETTHWPILIDNKAIFHSKKPAPYSGYTFNNDLRIINQYLLP